MQKSLNASITYNIDKNDNEDQLCCLKLGREDDNYLASFLPFPFWLCLSFDLGCQILSWIEICEKVDGKYLKYHFLYLCLVKLSFKVPGFFLLLRLIPSSGLPSESAELFPFLLLVFIPEGPLPIFLSSSLKCKLFFIKEQDKVLNSSEWEVAVAIHISCDSLPIDIVW